MARYPTQLFIKSVTNWRHSQVELIPTTEHHHYNSFIERKQRWENPTCEGRLICPQGRVASLNKCNPIQYRGGNRGGGGRGEEGGGGGATKSLLTPTSLLTQGVTLLLTPWFTVTLTILLAQGVMAIWLPILGLTSTSLLPSHTSCLHHANAMGDVPTLRSHLPGHSVTQHAHLIFWTAPSHPRCHAWHYCWHQDSQLHSQYC